MAGALPWRWDNIPESEYNHIIELYDNDKVDDLYDIHQKYNLSDDKYCCGTDDVMRNYFYDAIYVKKFIWKTDLISEG